MTRSFKPAFILILIVISFISLSAQQVQEIYVAANKPAAVVQPTMWGVFFEDKEQ